MPRIVHFEIHADNPDRADEFYSSVFGWKIEKWEGTVDYWMVTTGSDSEPGINGGIIRREGRAPVDGQPVTSFVSTVEIDDVDTYTDKVLENGGMVAVEKVAIPTVGYLAYCKDTEGNLFGLMQSDESAH